MLVLCPNLHILLMTDKIFPDDLAPFEDLKVCPLPSPHWPQRAGALELPWLFVVFDTQQTLNSLC